ncbi:MAG: BrnT family toxin [Chloroflexi bacterium]|nr:BrnT family toxin [Chloroflexota bacterium]
MRFEWDEEKNAVNIRRHKIDFADVPLVFNGPMLVELDEREDYGEDRWIGIGILRNIVAVVVFTEPRQDTIRIISARKANRHERKRYEQALTNRLAKVGSNDG